MFESRFTYHAPTPDQADRFPIVRNALLSVANVIDGHCPEGREKSLAITKLEEAMFWANAAIAREA